MVRLSIRLFGTPRIFYDGVPLRVAMPPRCIQLLAYLASHREPVLRSTVAAALWPDELEVVARSNLRRHIHQLKRGLPANADVAWLFDRDGLIGWNHDAPATIDVAEFARSVDEPQTRSAALELVSGDLLTGSDDEWLVIERERLRGRYLEALLDESITRRRQRDFPAAISYAERVLEADDLREDAVREIIAARYEAGDRGSALATYERFSARLATTLGVEPTAETAALAASLRAGTPIFDDSPEVPTRTTWSTAFAGRDAEIGTLRRVWMRAARGSGTTVFVGGEAGIGKSRLLAELADAVRAGRDRVVVAATSDPEAEPYQPILAALRRLLPFAAGLPAGDRRYISLARALPELRTLVRVDDDDVGARDESVAQKRLFDAIAAFIEHVARAKPLLLVLEDLHWSRQATIDAVGALARRIGSLPVLLVVTYRAEATPVGHPLRELRTQLAGERRATSLALRRLDAAAVRHMLTHSELHARATDVGPAIHQISDGNPLFVTQLARSYIETGELPTTTVPNAIGETIGRRIAAIEPEVRAIGEVAAVVGETFGLNIICDAGGWDEADVTDALGHLMDAAMIRETGSTGHGYMFTHALIAGVMYDAMPAAARTARHRRIAQLIERGGTHDRATLEAIARHWERSGDRSRASAAYARSALAALDVFARADAVALARMATDLAGDDIARFAALRIAAAAPARGGERGGWEADLERLVALAERLGDAEQFEASALREAYFWQSGRPEDSAAAIDAMIAIAERTGDALQRAIAYERRSRADVAAGRMREAMVHGREALRAASDHADAETLNRLRALASSIALRLGELEESAELLRLQRDALAAGGTLLQRMDLARAESMLAIGRQDGALAGRVGSELLSLARVAGDREHESLAHSLLAYAAHERYDAPAVREHYATAEQIYRELGRAQMLVNTAINHGIFEADIGRHADAIALWDAALPQAEALGMRPSVGYHYVHRAALELFRGNVAAAVAAGQAARALGEATAERRLYGESLVALGAALAADGDVAAALAALSEGRGELRAVGADRLVPELLAVLVETLLDAGRDVDARAAAEELRVHFFTDCSGMAEHHPARLALALVREADARGDGDAADAARTRGRRLLEERLVALGADAPAYGELPFNRELLCGPGTLR